MDAKIRRRCVSDAYGQAVWSCPPDAGVKRMEMIRSRRGLKSPVPRGEHGAAVKPLRRECRSDFGVPVLACVRLFRLHARQWVRRAPGIPCALCFQGVTFAKTRARTRRGNAKVCHCKES